MERRTNRTTNRNAAEKKAPEYGHVESYAVSRVRDTDYGIFFTLVINGVTVNDCRLVELEKDVFIGLPAKKGSDGKWYSTVYFRFDENDATKIINDVYAALEG